MKNSIVENLVRKYARAEIFRITRIAHNYEQSEMGSVLGGVSKSLI